MTGQQDSSCSLPHATPSEMLHLEDGPSIELDWAAVGPPPLPPLPLLLPAPPVRRWQKDPLGFFVVLRQAASRFARFWPTCFAALLRWAIIAFAAGLGVRILFYFFVDEWRIFYRVSGFFVLLFCEGSLHSALFVSLLIMASEVLDGFSVTSARIYSHLLFGPLLFLNFLLYCILVLLGMALFVLPGLYLAHALAFSFPLVADRKLFPWVALMRSFRGFNRQPLRLGPLLAFSFLLGGGGFIPYFIALILGKGLDWRFLSLLALPVLSTPLALLVFTETYGRMKNLERWE